MIATDDKRYSGWMPAAFMRRPTDSASFFRKTANSSLGAGSALVPRLATRALTSGKLAALTISSDMRRTTAAGVPVGAKVRLGITLLAVDDIPGGSQQTYSFVFECEGAAKPSCVAEVIFRSYE